MVDQKNNQMDKSLLTSLGWPDYGESTYGNLKEFLINLAVIQELPPAFQPLG